MLASIRRALRPGGSLVVVDFERIAGVSPDWILKHVRAGKEQFRAEIEAGGFRFIEEVKLMRENYFLRFSRD
jgi:predicted methyltransferase